MIFFGIATACQLQRAPVTSEGWQLSKGIVEVSVAAAWPDMPHV